ncbi:MAG: sulfurtransferase [Chromatiaceae bacterium]
MVDAEWVAENSCRDDVRVLDIRSEKIDGESQTEYAQGHIPCAVHSDYVKAGWRTKADGVPGMLPTIDQLERLIGGLGIDQTTQVVIAPLAQDAKSVAAAARVYWTFKVLGHDRVAILDGGTRGYPTKGSRALTVGAVTAQPREFDARLQSSMLVSRDEIPAAAERGVALVDYRRADEHLGITRNAKTLQPGTLRGARNLPLEWLTVDNGGTMRSPQALRQLMAVAEIDSESPQIAFCNTGHNSSLGWFVASELLGNRQVRLYDGSMAEWTRVADLPIDRKVAISH